MVLTKKKLKLSTVITLVVFVFLLLALRKLPAESSSIRPSPEYIDATKDMAEFISRYDNRSHELPLTKSLALTPTVRTPEHMVELINKVRTYYGLSPLTMSTVLNQTAHNKACDMLSGNYFAHEDLKGRDSWHLFRESGYHYQYAGENLAKDRSNQYSEMIGFMDSPEHRENILSTNYSEVGVGVCEKYTVQHFGAK